MECANTFFFFYYVRVFLSLTLVFNLFDDFMRKGGGSTTATRYAS